MSEQPVIYGLEYHARTLASQQGPSEITRFLVGTSTLKTENQIHVVEHNEEDGQLYNLAYRHPKGEVWQLSTSPTNSRLFSSVYSQVDGETGKCTSGASIWRLPVEEEVSIRESSKASESDIQNMEELIVLDGHDGIMKCVAWSPAGTSDQVVSVDESSLRLWDVNIAASTARLSSSGGGASKGQRVFSTARWNPHQNAQGIATADATAVRGWDLRSMAQTFCIENAHGQLVRDLDFNPNKQYFIVTCGDDNLVKFWDTRNSSGALMTLEHHTHWVWSVRYNHFHDQLVLSAGSDSHVVLSSVVSLSSDSYGQLAAGGDVDPDPDDDVVPEKKEPQADEVVRKYSEHEDSVYAVEWSGADPWVFASISYDGRLVINHVPKDTKYKILL